MRSIHKTIEAQFRFFAATLVGHYEKRHLSGVYSAFMDFSKYHFLDSILPYLADSIIHKKDLSSRLLLHKVPIAYQILCHTMLLISPVLPFTTEETFRHAFNESMYKKETYIIPASSRTTWNDDVSSLKSYKLMHDLKERLFPIFENIYKDQPRKNRKRLGLVVVYSENNVEAKSNLSDIGVEDLCDFLEVSFIRFVEKEAQNILDKSERVRASFRHKKMDLKLVSFPSKPGEPLTADSIED